MKPKKTYILATFVLPIFVLTAVVGLAQQPATGRPSTSQVEALPQGARWIIHLYRDLLPYWQSAEAIGTPPGRFPTFREADGSVVDPAAPLRGDYALLTRPDDAWVLDRLSRRYVRMMSRQTYFYGVAYHLTGDERMLELAKAGVDFLLQHAYDERTGAFVSYWENGEAGPPQPRRTSQDLSYALLGPTFYYYLTRDKSVLPKLLKAKDYIFQNYGGDPWDYLRWVNEDFRDGPDAHSKGQVELVAQLDQINAYMLLLTPILHEPFRTQWRQDLVKLTRVVKDRFYDEHNNVFWGRLNVAGGDDNQRLGAHHVDFGHTIKSFLMIYYVGRLVGDKGLVSFAEERIPKVLREAFVANQGTWGEKKGEDGRVVANSVWWIHAELDQAAATLSLRDHSLARYLVTTYAHWFEKFVDKRNGEVWHLIDGNNGMPRLPKAHLWKSGFHSAEHALVGYITSQAMRGEPVELYYAFDARDVDELRPYSFEGKVKSIARDGFGRLTTMARIRVEFTDIK